MTLWSFEETIELLQVNPFQHADALFYFPIINPALLLLSPSLSLSKQYLDLSISCAAVIFTSVLVAFLTHR